MNPTRPNDRSVATCVNVGVYTHALTYGDEYAILAHDTDKDQVQVRGDNGKPRWYPSYCFDMSGQQVLRRVRTIVDNPPDGLHSVDVVLELSDGQRRWCYFITPSKDHLPSLKATAKHWTVRCPSSDNKCVN